jgi:hypothetical protein
MKNKKSAVSPFLLVLIPVLVGVVYLTMQSDMQIPMEKYSASIRFQMPSTEVLVKSVYALFSWK